MPWGLTWGSLVPPPRRLLLALVLLALLLPWSLALAHGLQRLLGRGAAPRWNLLARGLAWLGVALTLWFGHQFLATGRWPLFIVPLGFLAASFVPSLPLWLLADRPGLSLARGVCHAGAAAWLLACHVPFVHA